MVQCVSAANVDIPSFFQPWAGNAIGIPSHTPNTNSSFSPSNQSSHIPRMGWVSGLSVFGYDLPMGVRGLFFQSGWWSSANFCCSTKSHPWTLAENSSKYPCLSLRRSMRNVPRFAQWQWSYNEGIAPCPSVEHMRLILPLLHLSKPMYLALNIKTSKYFKPREHSSSSFHIFMVYKIIEAYHFPSPHTHTKKK